MINDNIKNRIVLDEIRDKIELIESDIIPESLTHPLVSGIENTPTAIKSQNGENYAANFTTFPLSPLNGRVNSFKDNFLNISVAVNFAIGLCENIDNDIYLMVGPRDTASIINQLTLLIDNNTIYNTSYQQIESAINMAALPSSIVEHNNQYATIDKLLLHKDSPMKLIKIPAKNYADGSTATNKEKNRYVEYNLTYDFTIDLNRLCVLFSNMEFITSNMGNLRLKIYLNNILQSFYYYVVPPAFATSISENKDGSDAKLTLILNNNINSIISLNPIPWGSLTTNTADTVIFSNPAIVPIKRGISLALSSKDGTKPTISNANGNDIVDDLNLNNVSIPIQFIMNSPLKTNNNVNAVAVQSAEICQTCFDLEEESWNKLCEYFAEVGKVIMPVQLMTTTVFNNGTLEKGAAFPSTAIANIPANNISEIIISNVSQSSQSCLLNPYLANIQCLLDGKTLNNVPYSKIDNRAITDFTAACIDTDHDEINNDYLYSLTFPTPIIGTAGDLTATTYFTGTDEKEDLSKSNFFGNYKLYKKNGNLFMMVFETELQGAFHTGACVLENSNRQALLRLVSDGGATNRTNMNAFYKTWDITATIASNKSTTYKEGTSAIIPTVSIPNISNTDTAIMLTCLSDACVVLDYDKFLNTCIGGYISNAKPYISA